MRISKENKEIFCRCQGRCKICFNEGSCILENKIRKLGVKKVRKLVYNE